MNKVKFYRKKLGLTQQQLADTAGVSSKGYICDVENNRKEPGVYNAIKICTALKKNVETVFIGTDND